MLDEEKKIEMKMKVESRTEKYIFNVCHAQCTFYYDYYVNNHNVYIELSTVELISRDCLQQCGNWPGRNT